MTAPLRVFINGTAVNVEPGTTVRGALQAHDAALAERYAAGAAVVTDARGIEVKSDDRLSAGSILRVVIRSRRDDGSGHADA